MSKGVKNFEVEAFQKRLEKSLQRAHYQLFDFARHYPQLFSDFISQEAIKLQIQNISSYLKK